MAEWNRYEIGDARTILRTLPDETFHCCVTSPPYWGLRDYGIDGQIGLEETIGEYIETMVGLFQGVRRVLRCDGTLWLNLGDGYMSGGRATYRSAASSYKNHTIQDNMPRPPTPVGLKPKDLIGIPWRIAFALQEDGWFLRQDIIWSKPNVMPESVKDRCTKAHEYVFLMSKAARYYYDADAIKEPVSGSANPRGTGVNPKSRGGLTGVGWGYADKSPKPRCKQNESFSSAISGVLVDTRNKRSVWTVPTAAYGGGHYATYPPDLIKPCILTGAPPGGIVLDPFFGSGTTGRVCEDLGRQWFGIELNPAYRKLIKQRTAQVGLF